MPRRFVVFILLFLGIYSGLTYYVGVRGWQWIHAVAPAAVSGWVFWIPFVLLSASFVLARVGSAWLPRPLTNLLTVLGGYWLGVFQYALPLLIIIDLLRVVNRWLGVVPPNAADAVGRVGGGVVLGVFVVMYLYGVWRARHPVVVRYEINIPKSGGQHNELHIALVSDTHLGATNGNRRARHMVAMVNALNPDLILVAGDLMDDDLGAFVAANTATELRKLSAPLGVYSILGNHDVPGEAFERESERAGIRLLVDESVLVDESLVIIGRDDISGRRRSGRERAPLAALMQGVDRARPLILMDHQPYRLEEAQAAGIDLQVSGHTHRGQTYPFHYITRKAFELDWGYLYKPPTHVVVSLGFGTWGPPLRIGNTPEVVSIHVRFTA